MSQQQHLTNLEFALFRDGLPISIEVALGGVFILIFSILAILVYTDSITSGAFTALTVTLAVLVILFGTFKFYEARFMRKLGTSRDRLHANWVRRASSAATLPVVGYEYDSDYSGSEWSDSDYSDLTENDLSPPR